MKTYPPNKRTTTMKTFLNRSFAFAIALLIANLFFNNTFGQTVIQSTPGNYTFTVPANVTSITVQAWGGGGSGNATTGVSQRGGGGGAFATKTIAVSSGQVYNYTVGGTASNSYFGNTSPGNSTGNQVNAAAGSTASTVVGLGGLNTNCNPIVGAWSGGNGGEINGTTAGGGGGGSAGGGGDGGTAGAAPSAGMARGIAGSLIAGAAGGVGGSSSTSGDGANGSVPGGGGGGRQSGSGNTSGVGASGQIKITYTVCPTITFTTIISPINCFNANDGQIVVNSVTGGIGLYEYSINGGAYQSSNTFSSLAPGQYKIRVKDSNGCESKSVQ